VKIDICPNCFAPGPLADKCPACGYSVVQAGEASITLAFGTVLCGRYVIGRTLGVGGSGVTYLSKDTQTGELCAVKEYMPSQIAVRDRGGEVAPSGMSMSATYSKGLDMFAREASLLSAFHGNGAIVQMRDYFLENNTAYNVMEYIDGVTVRRLMRSMGGRLAFEHANELLFSVGSALAEVHTRGMLHRDVSPENIMVTRDGRFKLIDFGATRYFIGDQSKSLSIVLKPGFAPPEQYSSKGNQGCWTDVYALAATYYLAVGAVALPESVERLSGAEYPPLHTLEQSFPKEAGVPLDKALAVNIASRYQSMGDFLRDMGQALAKHAAPPPPTPDAGNAGKHTGAPCLKEFINGRAVNKWLLPLNMDILIGSTPECHIKPDGGGSGCLKFRFDDKQACLYIWCEAGTQASLSDNNPVMPGKVYKLKFSEGFSFANAESAFRLEVE
jgi:serine/threonine protein kinase